VVDAAMTDSELARFAYAEGVNPIDYAVRVAEAEIGASQAIIAARRYKPGAYPVFKGSLESDAIARRVIGALLDAGWTPPGTPFEVDPL
jgi:hypothetical protein